MRQYPEHVAQALDDLHQRNDELNDKLRTAERERDNAELRYKLLCEKTGRKIEDEDVLKPNC